LVCFLDLVGGSSRLVALCDLRVTSESQNRYVQTYTPKAFPRQCFSVSVSGLDLSRDREELLVSYESDQIYTFPVFPKSNMQSCLVTRRVDMAPEEGEDGGIRSIEPLVELASYGAHLNRFTFLKNARYAGPRDEYICTGSDSGHAWVYEKATGAVASFWMADNSTCNGVIPHPSLPVFVTYGIDSTAKLWRSATPVDPDVDDSAVGRRQHDTESSYEMSPTVRNWDKLESLLLHDGNEDHEVLPDQAPSTRVYWRATRIPRPWSRELKMNGCQDVPRIGNDLHNLYHTLAENLFTCLSYDEGDIPIESSVKRLKNRVSIIRLRYQADRLGLSWRLSIPWALECPQTVAADKEQVKYNSKDHNVDPADLVPDFSSDWLPCPHDILSEPFHFFDDFKLKNFKLEDYDTFYADRYRCLSERNGVSANCLGFPGSIPNEDDARPKLESAEDKTDEKTGDIFLETINTLKDGGNRALKDGNYDSAARRYDKAIQYGTMYMENISVPNVDNWNSLIKALVVSRLNMAHLLLKPHFNELDVAERQSKLALKELNPFVIKNDGSKMTPQTKDDILNLQSKAFFRLGSAQFGMGDYENAIKAFKDSINCTKKISNGDSKPDRLVVRRLEEATLKQVKRTNRRRKKFKAAFASTASPLAAESDSPFSPSGPGCFDAPTNSRNCLDSKSKSSLLNDRSMSNVDAEGK
jgi:tetratricopeptide (TPR) repeat protein